jgi:16S rRNA (adenine1518-N6/adenine1519-N6)-dimethyltransferase
VASSVVHFKVSPSPLFQVSDEARFLNVVKAAFSQRRKTILNSLKHFKGMKEAISDCGIDPGTRPEKLSIENFAALSKALKLMQ